MLVEYRFPYWYSHCPLDDCLFSIGTELTPDLRDVGDMMVRHVEEQHPDTPVYSLPTRAALMRGLNEPDPPGESYTWPKDTRPTTPR